MERNELLDNRRVHCDCATYAWFDLLLYLSSVFFIVYGISIAADSGEIFGYNEPAFYITFGAALFILYPVILEAILYILYKYRDPSPPFIDTNAIPIVYHPNYNITACGLENMHPFDSVKYRRIFRKLLKLGVPLVNYITPMQCPRDILLLVHPFWYLLSLSYSLMVARMIEVPVCFLPGPLIRFRVLKPMLLGTYGSIMGGVAALSKGWSINLSGGYHHCSSTSGGGFCVFADITLVVHCIRTWFPAIKRFLIVDLDAHQGNGYERDFLHDQDVYIIDFYRNLIYPDDHYAKPAIRHEEHIKPTTTDSEYHGKLEDALREAFEIFNPHFIVYNAGTDCMAGDPLGGLQISGEGIVVRDEIVFEAGLRMKTPLLMLLSGGYQKNNAPVIARSIHNLVTKFKLID